jgi:hypothetical protein
LAFNPNPATSSSTLTLTASATATPDTATVRVTGTSGNLTQTMPLMLMLTGPPDFTLGPSSGSPTSQTISAGQTASFPLTLASINSFSGTVNLSCAITPSVTAPPTCTLPGSSVQISGGTQSIMVNVGTTAPVTTGAVGYVGFPPVAMPLQGMLLLLGSVRLLLRYRKRLRAISVPAMMALAFCVSCGGGSSYTTPPPHTTPGTPSGTYTVTITATSGNLSHNLALQVIVR